MEIGRTSDASVGPGRVAFKVTLGSKGREALRRNGRLLIRLRMTIDPAAGPTYTGSRFVILRARWRGLRTGGPTAKMRSHATWDENVEARRTAGRARRNRRVADRRAGAEPDAKRERPREGQLVPAAAGGSVNTTIAAGESVLFSQSGSNPHNVVFKSTQPVCTQTSGTSSGTVPPLPNAPTASPWSGTCTFTAPATYTFYCAFHGEGMSGSITVPGVAPPPPPPPVSPPPPPVSPPPVSPPPPPPATTGAAATLLRVTTPQRSFTLRGSVNVSRAGSRLLARAFARRGALSGGRSTLLVQVARLSRASIGPGASR